MDGNKGVSTEKSSEATGHREAKIMRYEIDGKFKIVDFYIEDDSGREHHCGLGFWATKELLQEILKKIMKEA